MDVSIRKIWSPKGKDRQGDDRWALVQASHSVSLTELRLMVVVFGIEIRVSLCQLLKQTYKIWDI